MMESVNKSQIDATNMDDSTDNSYRQRVIQAERKLIKSFQDDLNKKGGIDFDYIRNFILKHKPTFDPIRIKNS